MSSSSTERLRALAGHLGIALLASMPMALSPSTRLVGHPHVDVWNHAWGPWWFWTRLSQGVLPVQTELLAAPVGGRLWFPDLLGALAGAPLVPLLGPILAWNLVVLFHLALASLGGRRLAVELGADSRASWVAAAGLACSPFVLSEVHNGISEAFAVGPSVLTLALMLRAARPGLGVREGILSVLGLGLVAGLTAGGSAYFSIGTATVGLLLLPWTLWRARTALPGVLLRLLLALGLALAIALPILRTAWWTLQADWLVFRPPVRELADMEAQLRHNAVDPRTFFWPGDFQSVDLSAEGFLHSSYLGVVVLLLALRARLWLPLLAVVGGLVLSLGPWLWYEGDWVLRGGDRLMLPYRHLIEFLPASALGHPQRVGLPAIALLLALAARGLSGLRPAIAGGLGALALVELLLVAPTPWPLARTPVVDRQPAAWIAAQASSPQEIVLDLPADLPPTMRTSRHLFYQALHGQPVPYKPDVRAGTASIGGLRSFRWLTGMEEGEAPSGGAAELERWWVRWVVVHRDLYDDEAEQARVEAALTEWYGPPEVVGEAAIYAR